MTMENQITDVANQTTETTTSTPIGILNSNVDLSSESDPLLPPRSKEMNFKIDGEDCVFTLIVDSQGNLTDFTATKENTTCTCSIQLTAENGGRTCCTPAGCTAGGC